MNETNYAQNQEKWDRGEVSIEACYRKGQSHRAYEWYPVGLGFLGTAEQREAYESGYNGKPMPAFNKQTASA